jgi:hypothetical protein
MLPGFRFLFGAIVLSVSVLIFGVGAAALLRAAHEEFASNPTWRAPAEPMFAQREATRPTLSVLQVNPPTSAAPVSTAGPADSADAPAADRSVPTGPDQNALGGPEQGSSPESVKAETSAAETLTPADALAAPAGLAAISTDTSVPVPAGAPAPSASRQQAVLGQAANESTASANAPMGEPPPATPSTETASASLAALGDQPAAETNTPPAHVPTRAIGANAETEAKQRARAERDKERRRAAQRARALTQAAVQEPGAAQQALSPQLFGTFPPHVQPAAAASRKR